MTANAALPAALWPEYGGCLATHGAAPDYEAYRGPRYFPSDSVFVERGVPTAVDKKVIEQLVHAAVEKVLLPLLPMSPNEPACLQQVVNGEHLPPDSMGDGEGRHACMRNHVRCPSARPCNHSFRQFAQPATRRRPAVLLCGCATWVASQSACISLGNETHVHPCARRQACIGQAEGARSRRVADEQA